MVWGLDPPERHPTILNDNQSESPMMEPRVFEGYAGGIYSKAYFISTILMRLAYPKITKRGHLICLCQAIKFA